MQHCAVVVQDCPVNVHDEARQIPPWQVPPQHWLDAVHGFPDPTHEGATQAPSKQRIEDALQQSETSMQAPREGEQLVGWHCPLRHVPPLQQAIVALQASPMRWQVWQVDWWQ